jgi:hypothetical protein
VETLAKVCGSGIDNMFLMTDADDKLEQITMQMFKENLSLEVFEGKFSCCEMGHKHQPWCDREKLVESVLGLYYHLLTQAEDPTVQVVLDHIKGNKERFFPKHFDFALEDGTTEPRELFGELVVMLEGRARGDPIYHTHAETCAGSHVSSAKGATAMQPGESVRSSAQTPASNSTLSPVQGSQPSPASGISHGPVNLGLPPTVSPHVSHHSPLSPVPVDMWTAQTTI